MNLWMKRAIGAAALSGGLLALSAGAASAQDVSADVSASLGRSTSAEVRVCADGRVLSGLLGRCSGSGTRGTVEAGRDDGSTGVRVRARLPRTARADVSVGTRRSRPGTTASGQATPRAGSARADASADTSPRADASASLTRRTRRLLDLDATASLAGVGLLGSSPFTLAGDPATDNLLPTGELTLADLTGEAPAGIGVLDTGPIASGNQVGVHAGDISPSVPVIVCGNGVGVLGDASASCAPGQPAAPGGGSAGTGSTGTSAGTGDATSDSLLGSLASGNQVDAGIGDISPSVPVTVCGNGVGVLGDASAGCGAAQPAAPGGGSSDSSSSGTTGSTQAGGTLAGNQVDATAGDISPSVPVTVCGNSVGALGDASASCGTGQPATSTGGASAGASGSSQADGTLAGNQAEVSVGDVAATVPVTASCNSVGLLGDASSNCGTSTSPGTDPGTNSGIDSGIDSGIGVDIGINTGGEISTGGIIAPPPGTTSPGGNDADGTPGSTGTSGIPGITGLTPGSGGADGSVTSFAPVRPSVAGSGALPFTGATSDLLAIAAFGLLVAGALVVRATRPAAAREGGGDR